MRFWRKPSERDLLLSVLNEQEFQMAAIDDLTAAVNRLITDFEAAKSAPQGTPDSALEALTSQINAADPAPVTPADTTDTSTEATPV